MHINQLFQKTLNLSACKSIVINLVAPAASTKFAINLLNWNPWLIFSILSSPSEVRNNWIMCLADDLLQHQSLKEVPLSCQSQVVLIQL